jgi:hypothetical protein
MNKLNTYGAYSVSALALFSAIWMFYHPRYEPDGSIRTVYQDVTDKTHHNPTVKCQDNHLVVTGNTPPASQEGPKYLVIASGDVPASTGGFELKTTLSPSTGEATIWAKLVPRPLFGFEDSKEIGLRYNGVSGGAYARWTFVRVGSVYGSLYGDLYPGHSFAGLEVSYRF